MEQYLNIEGLASYLKISEATIRSWVLKREVPFHKINGVIRFRLSEIEKWIDEGGYKIPSQEIKDDEKGLFTEQAETITETETGETE